MAPLVFLAPLAGLAALYAMAYVNSNPALLSLVAISGRKKRSLSLEDRIAVGDVEDMDYLNEVGKPRMYLYIHHKDIETVFCCF